MGCLARGLLGHLNPTSARADNAHPFAVKVQTLLRPQCRVMTRAAERIDPLDRWEVWLGGEADADQEEAGPRLHVLCFAYSRLNPPFPARFIKLRRPHPGPKTDVAAKVEFSIDEFEIGAHLFKAWVHLAPVPLAPEFLPGELVNPARGIDAGTGITIPVPYPTQTRACLEQAYLKPQRTQTIEQIHAGKSGTHDQYVERLGFSSGLHTVWQGRAHTILLLLFPVGEESLAFTLGLSMHQGCPLPADTTRGSVVWKGL